MIKKIIASIYFTCILVSLIIYYLVFTIFSYRLTHLDQPTALNFTLLITYYPAMTFLYFISHFSWIVAIFLIILVIFDIFKKKDKFRINILILSIILLGLLWNWFIISKNIFSNMHQY